MSRPKPHRRLLVLVPTPREAELLFGEKARGLGAPRLVTLASQSVRVALTGFGLAAAGATAGRWFAKVAPDAAALVGVAGTFDPLKLPLGSMLEAEAIGCDGVGAGEGDRFAALDEPPLPGVLSNGVGLAPLTLAPACDLAQRANRPALAAAVRGELLSVAAAAASFSMAESRRRRHPRALAEEMEGYAVALAALVARVPLTILRGASNVAGDREHGRWKIEEALAPCRAALEEWAALATA